jgi:hypothetical protein
LKNRAIDSRFDAADNEPPSEEETYETPSPLPAFRRRTL